MNSVGADAVENTRIIFGQPMLKMIFVEENKMHDSGKREQFESGAVRDTAEGKSRPDLVSPYAEERIGNWMAKGAEKYDERNWEKGISISRCVASISRHLIAFKMGLQDEDHLAAIAVNAQFIMHYQTMISRGKLPATLEDMPDYEDIVRREELEKLLAEDDELTMKKVAAKGPVEIDGPQFKAGDEVHIHLHPDTPLTIKTACQNTSNKGSYVKAAGVIHEVQIGSEEFWFRDGEITLVENN